MGKPKLDSKIPKCKNINKLLNASGVCNSICTISYEALNNGKKEDSKKQIIEKVSEYYKNSHDELSDKYQCGKVWFLVKKQREALEVLQVAQAIDYDISKGKKGFFDEIYSHINEMFEETENNIYSSFAKEIGPEQELIFYELDIEKYLEEFAPLDYKEYIYRMAREYFAEASVAHFTQSREWGFYNSGMDKRALYYLYENINQLDIDKQRD